MKAGRHQHDQVTKVNIPAVEQENTRLDETKEGDMISESVNYAKNMGDQKPLRAHHCIHYGALLLLGYSQTMTESGYIGEGPHFLISEKYTLKELGIIELHIDGLLSNDSE